MNKNINQDLDYYADLPVDPNRLDEAIEKQAVLFMQYSELAGDKRDQVNEQKKVLKVIDAELKEISAKLFMKYKNDKIEGKSQTDTACNNLVLLDKEYKDCFDKSIKELEKYNKLCYQLDILDSVVTSFQQRKNMIEERIKLYQLGYNSEVRQKNYNDYIHDRLNKRKSSAD